MAISTKNLAVASLFQTTTGSFTGVGAITGTVHAGREMNLAIADYFLALMQKERNRLSSGVERESNIALIGVFLIGIFLFASPLLALFGVPVVFYGWYTHRQDKRELKKIIKNLELARDAFIQIRI
jgi:hypothetical protein